MAKRAWSQESKDASKSFIELKKLCEDRSLEGFSEFGLDDGSFKRVPKALLYEHKNDLSALDFFQHMQKEVSYAIYY